MLSAAKDLLFLVGNKQKQIPRSARDDMVGALFHQSAKDGSLSFQDFADHERVLADLV